MNAIDLLKDDHQKLKKTLESIGNITERTKDKRTNLLAKAKAELLAHELVEEKLIYPILEKSEDSHSLALEAYEEHHFANVILAEIEKIAPNEIWMAKFAVFKENIYHHIKEEESQLFKGLKKICGKAELEELAKQIKKFKREYKKHN